MVDFLDIGQSGPDWKTRLRPGATLVSPSGVEFFAKWIGSPREKTNRVPLYDFPGIPGTAGLDLRFGSDRYPMKIYFDGPNHDVTAQSFWDATSERGEWNVVHPIHGFRALQLLSVKQNDEPVREGNYTAFDLEWIELIDPETLKTTTELRAAIGAELDTFNGSAVDQFSRVITNTQGALQAITAATEKVQTFSDNTIGRVARASAEVGRAFDAVNRGIQDTLDATVLAPIVLAAQIQQLVQLPALAVQDTFARLKAYKALAEKVFGIGAAGDSDQDHNTALVKEVTLCATIGANAQVSRTGTAKLQSRSKAVGYASDISKRFKEMVDSMDADQALFQTANFEKQYFSQSSSYTDALSLTALAVDNFLASTYDLKIERIIKLDRPRCVAEIAITEYGGPGINDANIDLFIASNQLHGEDVILLPAGREVLIYV